MMDINVAVVVVVALMAAFGMPMIIVALALAYKMRKNRLVHGTILSLAEKGVPIPPELIVPPQVPLPAARVRSDLKTGILLIAAGAGICLFFFELQTRAVSLGVIPMLMGLGYIVAWKIEKPPQSGA
jgi:hypothetical protein